MIDRGKERLEDLFKILQCSEMVRIKLTRLNNGETERRKSTKLPRLGARVYKSQVLKKNVRRKGGIGMAGIYHFKEDMDLPSLL